MKETKVEKQQTSAPVTEPEAGEPLVSVPPTSLTAEEIDELKQRAAKADENWDRLVRTTADFDNYKKRAVREKQEAVKFANESLLEKLMPVLDNFDMALAASQTASTDASQSLLEGVNMIYQQFKKALVEAGLEEIDATGKTFDPRLHEAIAQQETPDVAEGQVVQQLRKGYKLRDRLLRAASVIVSKEPAA